MNHFREEQFQRKKTKKIFYIQIVFGTAFAFLTGGVFLSGFAMYMGASDLLVSYISMITNICGISIFFFSGMIGRFGCLKQITIALTILSKLATLFIVLIPMIVPKGMQIAVFIFFLILAFTLQAQTTVMMNNWLMNFVDKAKSGKYIARRQTCVVAVTVILSIAGGQVLDVVSGGYMGFAILFGVSFCMFAVELSILLRIPDAVQQKSDNLKGRFGHNMLMPLRCRPFLNFVVYIVLFYLILSIADSFTVVYMMRYLGLSYTVTTMMQMLISLPQLFLLRAWGKISDKRGHQFALKLSIWFFVGETLFMALSNGQNLFVFVPIAFLFAAIANAGFVISVFNRRYELMPQEGRVLYDNFYSAAVGIAFILGPAIGGIIKQGIESVDLLKRMIPFGNIRLLYVLSTSLIIVLQVCFSTKKAKTIQKGEV